MVLKRTITGGLAFIIALWLYGTFLERSFMDGQDWNPRVGSRNASPGPGEECALIFFGLPKHFKDMCLPSIRRYIIRTNPTCDVYAHTYDIRSTSNARNGEETSPVHPEDVFLLTASTAMDTESDFLAARNISYYRTAFPKPSSWVYPTSMDNMIKQWHSIDRAWKMMEESGKTYR
jgi:hypothetical protein